jgi:steroid delta-isomerase-like uncharacterized protein
MGRADDLRHAWSVIEDEGQLDRIGEFYADDFVRHSDDGETDRDGFQQILRDLHDAFPDLTFALLDLVEEGNKVAYRWESVGTHESPYMGAPATHKRIVARGLTISRFDDDGRIVEDWASWNKVSVLHSLGIMPVD